MADESSTKTPADMLVKDLKEELKKRNLPVTGLKAELVQRLEEAIAKDNENPDLKLATPVLAEGNDRPAGVDEPADQGPHINTAEMEQIIGEKIVSSTPLVSSTTLPNHSEAAPESSNRKEENLTMEEVEHAEEVAKREEEPKVDETAKLSSVVKEIEKKEEKTEEKMEVDPEESKKRKVQQENTKRGNGRDSRQEKKLKTAETTSEKSPSRFLFIRNFVRPFTKNAVEALLKQKGNVEQWEMDPIKSKAYVAYSTSEEAIASKEHIHDLEWPPANHNKLIVEFSNEQEAKNFFASNTAGPKPAPQPTEPTESAAPSRRAAAQALRDASKSVAKEPKKVAPPSKTLDDIFVKTVAKPHIYYLPLSDDDIEKKTGRRPIQNTKEESSPVRENKDNENTADKI